MRHAGHPLRLIIPLLSSFQVFRRPIFLLRHYFSRTPLPARDREIEFRDGTRFCLSGHKDDVVTLFVVFLRGEYGTVPAGATVLDVGANIGAFSVHAIKQGARRVLAFEPCLESFQTLQRNIQLNQLGDRVNAFPLAVSDVVGQGLPFPVSSDPSNSLFEDHDGETRLVESITLEQVLAQNRLDEVDLLKLDCEGAEYPILLRSPDEVLRRVREIRMEFHAGRTDEIISRLKACGFELTRSVRLTEANGSLWFRRVAAHRLVESSTSSYS